MNSDDRRERECVDCGYVESRIDFRAYPGANCRKCGGRLKLVTRVSRTITSRLWWPLREKETK
jgi:hypothetical protein